MVGEVFLDQHAPDSRRRAQAGHAAALQRAEQSLRVEACAVVDEDAGAGVPGRKEATPGVLGPSRRRNVHVNVARAQSQPVHRRQVADWVALVRVQHQLGLGGRARGEVEQHGIGGEGRGVGHVRGRGAGGVAEWPPAGGRVAAHRDARVTAGQRFELDRLGAGRDHVPHLAALHAVAQVFGRQQHRGRNQHRAELDRREHHLPQRQLVAQHHQHAVTALHAQTAQMVGDLGRALRHLAKAAFHLAAVLTDDPQRGCVGTLGVARHPVEMVQRPIEFGQLWPAEFTRGGDLVVTQTKQQVAGFKKRVDGVHAGVHAGVQGGAGWVFR